MPVEDFGGGHIEITADNQQAVDSIRQVRNELLELERNAGGNLQKKGFQGFGALTQRLVVFARTLASARTAAMRFVQAFAGWSGVVGIVVGVATAIGAAVVKLFEMGNAAARVRREIARFDAETISMMREDLLTDLEKELKQIEQRATDRIKEVQENKQFDNVDKAERSALVLAEEAAAKRRAIDKNVADERIKQFERVQSKMDKMREEARRAEIEMMPEEQRAEAERQEEKKKRLAELAVLEQQASNDAEREEVRKWRRIFEKRAEFRDKENKAQSFDLTGLNKALQLAALSTRGDPAVKTELEKQTRILKDRLTGPMVRR